MIWSSLDSTCSHVHCGGCRCWNANSGDTGGLVDDSWLTIQWPKVDFLTVSPNAEAAANAAAPGGWGLTPWYLSS